MNTYLSPRVEAKGFYSSHRQVPHSAVLGDLLFACRLSPRFASPNGISSSKYKQMEKGTVGNTLVSRPESSQPSTSLWWWETRLARILMQGLQLPHPSWPWPAKRGCSKAQWMRFLRTQLYLHSCNSQMSFCKFLFLTHQDALMIVILRFSFPQFS